MTRHFLICVLLAGCVVFGGCSVFHSKPKPVDLCFRGSPELQWYENRAHTLYIRAYPLQNIDGFASANVNELLADPPPVFAGVAGEPQSKVLYPGTAETLTFDRKEHDFPHLGVVAGYYDLRGQAKKVVHTIDLRRGGWFRKRPCYTVNFGPSGIEADGSNTDKK